MTVRYFAAARAATGVAQEELTVENPATLTRVLAGAVDRHGSVLSGVLRRCSYLLNETAVHGPSTLIPDGAQLDVLPPFAGG